MIAPNMINLPAVVRRAAQRVPGPAAERSLAQVGTLHRYAPLDVALSEPDSTLGLLKIGKRESWCLRCGETVNEEGFCPRCGARRSRPAVEVLQPDEYFVAR